MIPSLKQPFRFSKPALVLILASTLLAAILTLTTLRNMNREQHLLENFLLQEGLTLIRSFEAGARTSMMHHMNGIDPLQTLVAETTKEKSVVYIRIVWENGETVAEAGELPPPMSRAEITKMTTAKGATTRTVAEDNIFQLAQIFEPLPPLMPMRRMMQRRQRHSQTLNDKGRQLIVVGLGTLDFNRARVEDRNRAFFMGAVLFLLGTAGLYFLFLYQSIRVGKSTLANMELYTKNVIESMPDGLITLDSTGSIVSCNYRAEQLLSRPLPELKDLPLEELFSPLPSDLEHQPLLLEKELFCRDATGEEIPIRLSTSPLLDHQGHQNGLVLILRDMRDIRKIEQQLELSRRLASLGRMAAGVAHEIRNPLGTLRGFAQYFGHEAGPGTDGQRYADLMISEVDRLNQTISGLLQFARARKPQLKRFQAQEFFSKVTTLMEADFGASQIAFHQQFDPELSLFADPDLLLQVLLNLLKNSISVTASGGQVTLNARNHDGEVTIAVTDTGRGMTAEEQEKLFDPFFSTRKDGTGMGLAVSHQIVEQHHGRIEVSSKRDLGTIMKVILPGENH